MANPYVISMKAVLNSDGVKAGTVEAERALVALNQNAAKTEQNLKARIDRTVGISANTRSFREAQTDISSYGRSLDEMRARYNPIFAAHMRYRQSLADIRQAHAVGAIGADEMAGAIQRERQAALASIAALKGRTSALHSMSAASGRLSYQQQNLLYQLVDVGQMLALQQPLHMLALQQGPQIAQIYGPGEGGIGRAFSESASLVGRFLTKFAKIGVVTAVAVGAVAGFAHELDKTTKKSVGMGDAIIASFQVIGDGLYAAYIKPFETQIDGFFKWVWDGTIWLTKTLINSVVVTAMTAGMSVEYALLGLSKLLSALAAKTQNFFVDILQSISDFIVGGINTLIRTVDGLVEKSGQTMLGKVLGVDKLSIGEIVGPDLSGLKATETDLKQEFEALNQTYGDAFNKLFTEDHAGKFFEKVSNKVIKNLSNVTDKSLKATERLKAAYNQIIETTKDRIAGLELEQQTLGMTSEAANRLRYTQDLMNQAQRAGIKLTPTQISQLQGLAGTLAAVEAQTQRLTEAYDFSKSVFTEFFGEWKSGLSEGKNLWEAFGGAGISALNKIADKAISMAASGIFDMIFSAFTGAFGGGNKVGLGFNLGGGGGGNFFSQLLGIGRNAQGTEFWRGGLSWVGENGPEIVNLPRGAKVIPNHDVKTMVSSPYRAGLTGANNNTHSVTNQNGMNFTYAPSIDARGSTLSPNELKRVLEENNRTVQHSMPGWIRQAQKRAQL